MKTSAQKGNTFLIILICAAIIIGAMVFATNSFQKSTPVTFPSPTPTTTKFQSSKVMDFSISLPSEYNASEKFNRATFVGKNGVIYIDSIGSNFNQLEDYVNFLQEKNGFKLKNIEKQKIQDYQSIRGYDGNQYIYFVLPQSSYTVYALSTKSPQLYSVLDQTAKSFRYTP